MKPIPALLPATALAFLLAGCATPVQVSPIGKDQMKNAPAGKLFYALPHTVVDVQFTQVTDVIREGPLYSLREQYKNFLGLEDDTGRTNFVTRANGSPTITNVYADPKTLVVSPRPVPAEWFAVDLKSGALESRKIKLMLEESGLITGAGDESENHTLGFIAETVKFAGGVAAAAAGTLGPMSNTNPVMVSPVEQAAMAQSVSNRIEVIRAKKDELLSSKLAFAASKEALEYQMSKLKDEEDALIAKFDYELVERQQNVVRRSFRPEPGMTPNTPALEEGGVKLAVLSLEGEVPQASNGTNGKTSFYYRLPRQANFQIQCKSTNKKGGETFVAVGNQRLNISQFGSLHALPGESNAASLAQEIEFHGGTGALKVVGSTRKPAETSAIYDNLGAGVKDIIAAERENSDELASMKREIEILQNRETLNELRAKAAPAAPAKP